jgi:predicted CXXCH cytochrome family protein
MTHGYYNEWQLSKHARSLRYRDGQVWSAGAKDSCLPCHSGEGFLKSIGYGSDGPNDIGILPSKLASDTLGVECGVCHTVHAKTGDALGLRLPADELCSRCHNAGVAVGREATPGAKVNSSQAELFGGYGLIGVAPAPRAMGEAKCVDCHMPVTYGSNPSHRFTPMLPGEAETWGVPAGGDSCTRCHAKSRDSLQASIDGWKADIGASIAGADAAVAAARMRPSAATPAGARLIASAVTNVGLVTGDGSGGVHNHAYAKAGLDKAVYFARSAGGGFPAFAATSFDTRSRVAVVYGRLVLGDKTARAGEKLLVDALPAGSSRWVTVATLLTGATGDFAAAVASTTTTRYRARWAAGDAATTVYSGEAVVAFSTTAIKVSPASAPVGRVVTVSGSVSPAHPRSAVTIQYHLGPYSWRTLTTATLNSASGFAVPWKASGRGTWYFRAVFAGDASHAGSTSAAVKVQVY